MQQQQAAFLEAMEDELESDDESDEKEESSLECVMCRERGSKMKPLGQVIWSQYMLVVVILRCNSISL